MSKSKLRRAKHSINQCLKQINGYSHASRADMRHMLNRCIKDLHGLGYKVGHIKGLKPKHIHVLVEHWQKQGKNTGTIKNYMAKLRKLAVALGRPGLVKSDNNSYQISQRSYVPKYNKALSNVDFSTCSNTHIRLSLEAQALFGLRREESMKIVMSEAWQGSKLIIRPSWSKGGVGREIPITSDEQREWLKKARSQAPVGHSLIPRDKTYKQHLSLYQTALRNMGIRQCHGLRHAYAQKRYAEITKQCDVKGIGLVCPIQGGKAYKALNDHEKYWDRFAREQISHELGHSRLSITKVYLG